GATGTVTAVTRPVPVKQKLLAGKLDGPTHPGGRRRAMNIVVLVKQVPDSGAERALRPDDRTVDRDSANNVINEMDEYAIEEALKVKEAHGGEVTILTMGPASATESIRKALSMGPDKAVHVLD